MSRISMLSAAWILLFLLSRIESSEHACMLEKWTKNDLWNVLDCDEQPRLLHNATTFGAMRQIHAEITQQELENTNSMHVDVTVRHNSKGRGVYAAQAIPKDTLVWSAQASSVRFLSGTTFRHFLAQLPPAWACDILQWSYVLSLDDDRPRASAVMGVDLDAGSFFNTATRTEPANVQYRNPCLPKMEFVALRDIAVEEELITRYDYFTNEDGWGYFGL